MLPLVAVAIGAVLGFIGSRQLRRSPRVARAPKPASPASVARSASAGVSKRKGLTAPELQRACFSEMVRHVRVNRQGKTQAPARYMIQLHPDDLATIDEAHDWFVDGLSEALVQAAADNAWELDGTADIKFEGDVSRRPGAPNALAVDPQPIEPAAPRAARASGWLAIRRTDTSETVALTKDPLTVGRGSDRELVIDDTRVSRLHATIATGRSGWTLTDEGSSNGTTLNGRLVTPNAAKPIKAGDVIGVGPVEIQVEAADPPDRDPGTRALDDSDRTRISGEVLPPPRRPRP